MLPKPQNEIRKIKAAIANFVQGVETNIILVTVAVAVSETTDMAFTVQSIAIR